MHCPCCKYRGPSTSDDLENIELVNRAPFEKLGGAHTFHGIHFAMEPRLVYRCPQCGILFTQTDPGVT